MSLFALREGVLTGEIGAIVHFSRLILETTLPVVSARKMPARKEVTRKGNPARSAALEMALAPTRLKDQVLIVHMALCHQLETEL